MSAPWQWLFAVVRCYSVCVFTRSQEVVCDGPLLFSLSLHAIPGSCLRWFVAIQFESSGRTANAGTAGVSPAASAQREWTLGGLN
jgi:hypothetical protein